MKPITIWAVSATFGFFGMFAAALWHSVNAEDLETKLSIERALYNEQEQYLVRLQKHATAEKARADLSELTNGVLKQTITVLTEACSSECNQACWSKK